MLFFCCLSFMYVRGGGNRRGRLHVVPQENCRPTWINAVSALALPVVPPPTGWALTHCLCPSGAPHTLMAQCLLPPHVLSLRPHSFAWQEAVSFLLLDGDIFLRSLILLLVLLPLWVGLLVSTLAAAPFPLLFTLLMRNWVLRKGLSDYPRVLNCIEKNNCTWVHPGPPPIRKVPESSHTPF